jgi:hypothetical protein
MNHSSFTRLDWTYVQLEWLCMHNAYPPGLGYPFFHASWHWRSYSRLLGRAKLHQRKFSLRICNLNRPAQHEKRRECLKPGRAMAQVGFNVAPPLLLGWEYYLWEFFVQLYIYLSTPHVSTKNVDARHHSDDPRVRGSASPSFDNHKM